MHSWQLLRPFRERNFRIYWTGQGLAMLGMQFYMIALPWLVLRLTGDPFAMGTVLALASVPRAVFMLVGGTFIDHFTPRNVLVFSAASRVVMNAILAGLVVTGLIELWMLYIIVTFLGVFEALGWPASTSLIPEIAGGELLQSGNAIVQGTGRLTGFLGPALAGLLIAWLAGAPAEGLAGAGDGLAEARGIALAIGVSVATSAFAGFNLLRLRLRRRPRPGRGNLKPAAIAASVKEGFLAAWEDPVIRLVIIMLAATDFIFIGVVRVGIPTLADARFPGGAAAFGMIVSGLGAGAFAGTIMAGALPFPGAGKVGPIFAASIAGIGAGVIGLAFAPTMELAMIGGAAIGFGDGYFSILMVTLVQARAPEEKLGRVVSMMLFASVGFAPISTALMGALIGLDVTVVLLAAGVFSLVAGALSFLHPMVRAMPGIEPA